MLLACSGQKPGLLLSVLKCTGHPHLFPPAPPQERIFQPKVSVELRLRDPDVKDITDFLEGSGWISGFWVT